jgi:hypothetical protein
MSIQDKLNLRAIGLHDCSESQTRNDSYSILLLSKILRSHWDGAIKAYGRKLLTQTKADKGRKLKVQIDSIQGLIQRLDRIDLMLKKNCDPENLVLSLDVVWLLNQAAVY